MKEAPMAVPHLFRCPISLDLFTDPVTLCTGQTYDRPSIEKWLAAGNLTCPVTMQRLHDATLVPNHTLRHLIDQWLRPGSRSYDHYLKIDPDLSLAALKHNLESGEVSPETKLQALERIAALIEELPSKSCCLAQLGFLQVLLELLLGPAADSRLAEEAVSCVLKLTPLSGMGALNLLRDEARARAFLVQLEHGTAAVRAGLCRILEAAAASPETQELCVYLGESPALLRAVVRVVKQSSEAAEAGARAILAMCCSERNRRSLVREGAVDGLVTCIGSAQGGAAAAAAAAVAAIEPLMQLGAAKRALVGSPDGVKALVRMVFRVSDHEGSESAVNCLMVVCCESAQAREKAISAGVLTQLLLLMQSQCGSRTKIRARALLKLLKSMWAKEAANGV